ncbi:MAG: oligosaccharide flippase family protein [Verrucomicrobia bacterium]|nr:oligosaccharide flippase family protein [Verrucomicrobiota bacterium]
MARFHRFVHSLASGYAVIAVNVLYTLAAVPLALHFLTADEFGLWAVMLQLSGYVALLDLGMSPSVARLLIDYKDRAADGSYGGLIQTGWLVSLAQGGISLLAGLAAAPGLAGLLAIPQPLTDEFVLLLRWQCALLAAGFATRMFHHLLAAHQRLDAANYAQIGAFGVNFLVLWLGFRQGWGVFSLLWANAAGWLAGGVISWWACSRLKLWPTVGAWGRPTWPRFKETFAFGTDIFLVTLGSQLILASQTLVITRCLGLSGAAVWTVCTKSFTLLCQLLWRIFDASAPAFSEMIVRGERERIFHRFRDLTILTASVSGVAAVLLALCNGPFVALWTKGRLAWSAGNDLLLALCLIVQAVNHCHSCLVLLTKEIGFLRFIYLGEGVAFVTLAALVAAWGGMPVILLCSLGCSIVFSLAYGIHRTTRYFNVGWREAGGDWSLPLVKILAVLTPAAAVLGWALAAQADGLRLGVSGAVGGALGGLLFFRWGIPASLQREMVERAPRALQRPLQRLFAPDGKDAAR